jgi:1-deoxy-D-xylulose-5-phosphate synthase
MLADAADHRVVVTAEDGVRMGGAGMYLADTLRRAADEEGTVSPPVIVLGVPRTYIPQGEVDDILAGLGLDGPGIAASVRHALCGREAARGDRPVAGDRRSADPR